MRRSALAALALAAAAAAPAAAQPSETPAAPAPPEVPPVSGAPSDNHDTGAADPAENAGARPVRVAVAPSMTPPTPAVPPVSEVAPEATAGLAGFAARDAAAGRAYVTPTAATSAGGTGGVTAWFPVVPVAGLVTASYAVGDRVELAAGGMFVYEEEDTPLYLAGKVQVVRGRTRAVAVQVQHLRIPDEDERLWFATAVGSTCVDGPRCRTLASLHVTAVPVEGWDDGRERRGLAFLAGASLITGGRTKAVFDLVATDTGDGDLGAAAFGGVRVARARWAADLGLACLIESDNDTEWVPLPLSSLSFRF